MIRILLFTLLILPGICHAQMEAGLAGMYLPHYKHAVLKVGHNGKNLYAGIFGEYNERGIQQDLHKAVGIFFNFRPRTDRMFTVYPALGVGWADAFFGSGVTVYAKVGAAVKIVHGLYFNPEAGMQMVRIFVNSKSDDIFFPVTVGLSYRFNRKAVKVDHTGVQTPK